MKRKYISIAIMSILILLLTGCASINNKMIPTQPRNLIGLMRDSGNAKSESKQDYSSMNDSSLGNAENAMQDKETSQQNNKIIVTMEMKLETTEFEKTISTLESNVNKHSGFIESANVMHNQYVNWTSLANAEFTVRISKGNLANFMKDAEGLGNIISESTFKNDVTSSYKDIQSRLNLYIIKEERISELLKKANKMEDIILLENQLTDIIHQKEQLSQSLLSIDDKVDYSTIHFQINEVAKYTEQTNEKTPFFTKAKIAVKDSFYAFAKMSENIFIAGIYAFPYMIITIIIILLIYNKRKHKNTKQAKKEQDNSNENINK